MFKSNENDSVQVYFHKSEVSDEEQKTNEQEKPACTVKTEIINESELSTGDNVSNEVISTNSKCEAEPVVIVPPDGGWGWFVIFVSFICNLIIHGVIFSFAILFNDIVESFNDAKSQVAIVGSLLSSFYLLAGPFVSALINKYGFQKVTIVGSVIGALAFVGAAFTVNVTTLAILYGFVGGIGFGFVYVPSIIILGFYFEKWRALATGLAVCGSGIGKYIFSGLTKTWLKKFGWRTSLMLQAGCILLCALLGAVYRPIKPKNVTLDTKLKSRGTRTISENDTHSDKDIRSRHGTMAGNEIQQPFYRDDIFCGESLDRLHQHTSHTSLECKLAKTDKQEENQHTYKNCSETIRRTCSTMFDFSILVSPTFIILTFSGCLAVVGFYKQFVFIFNRAIAGGLDFNSATWLLSVIGIANIIGNILWGIISSCLGHNALIINNIVVTIGGIITLVSGLSMSLRYQIFYASIFGLSISCFETLRSVIIVELFGLERLTNAFGFLIFFQGIAIGIGFRIIAVFIDLTDARIGNEVNEEAELIEGIINLPPDGGWGWVVVCAAFLYFVIIDGLYGSTAVFIQTLATEFHTTRLAISTAVSLLHFFYYFTGPIVCAIANKYGFQLVIFVGTVLNVSGWLAASYCDDIYIFYIFWGVCIGAGGGFTVLPAVLSIGFYFEKWRAFATGLAVCGSGIGVMVWSVLGTYLLKRFGWRNAFRIIANTPINPLRSNVAIQAASHFYLLGRISPLRWQIFDLTTSTVEKIPERKGLINRVKVKLALIGILGFAYRPVPSLRIRNPTMGKNLRSHSTISKQGFVGRLLSSNSNYDFPSTSHFSDNPNSLTQMHRSLEVASQYNMSYKSVMNSMKMPTEQSSCVTRLSETESKAISLENEMDCTVCITQTCPCCCCKKVFKNTVLFRPLYRDDVFFNASLQIIPEYSKYIPNFAVRGMPLINYHLTITRLVTHNDLEEKSWQCCKRSTKKGPFCTEAVRRALATLLHIDILKSLTFNILALSGCLSMVAMFIPSVFIIDYALSEGIHIDHAKFLLTTLGGFNTIGRILCGSLVTVRYFTALQISYILLTVAGVITILMAFFHELYMFFAFSAIYGITIANISILRPVLLAELFGIEKLTNAFGVLMIFHAVGSCVGVPLGGYLMDLTGSYSISFMLAGGLHLLGSILLMFLKHISKWEHRKR